MHNNTKGHVTYFDSGHLEEQLSARSNPPLKEQSKIWNIKVYENIKHKIILVEKLSGRATGGGGSGGTHFSPKLVFQFF